MSNNDSEKTYPLVTIGGSLVHLYLEPNASPALTMLLADAPRVAAAIDAARPAIDAAARTINIRSAYELVAMFVENNPDATPPTVSAIEHYDRLVGEHPATVALKVAVNSEDDFELWMRLCPDATPRKAESYSSLILDILDVAPALAVVWQHRSEPKPVEEAPAVTGAEPSDIGAF